MKKSAAYKKAKEILGKMTLDEKIEMLEGLDGGHMQGVERLGIPNFRLSDGPLGAQGATAMPSAITVSSSFDRDLAYRYGQAVGKDSRAMGYHCLLGPGMNIIRTPLAGRSSEYYSEDPYISAEMATETVKGIQSQGVWACAKHFVANSMENWRTETMSMVDERTMREIYMPAFEKSVKDGNVVSVMDAYNAVNGERCCRNVHYNVEILKNEWGFDGFTVSDWGAGQGNAEITLMKGLDLAMPVGEMGRPASTKPLMEKGLVTEERIDDAVMRILTKAVEFGFIGNKDIKKGFKVGGKKTDDVIYETCAKGTVLLKNKGMLPLAQNIKIAVMGPNALSTESGILGSSHVDCKCLSFYDAIKKAAKGSKVTAVKDILLDAFETTKVYHLENGVKTEGWLAEYYYNSEFDKEPSAVHCDKNINTGNMWANNDWIRGVSGISRLGIIWNGTFVPEKSGTYVVAKKSNSGTVVTIDGETVIDDVTELKQRPYIVGCTKTVSVFMEKGREYQIRVKYSNMTACHACNISFAVFMPDYAKIRRAARNADVVIFCAGVDYFQEGEGVERAFDLPGLQNECIAEAAKVNKNVAVLHNGCGAFGMDMWENDVAAILQCWYPGQSGTRAVADILTGKINPSGKLPVSFDRTLEENPSIKYFYPDTRRPYMYPIYYNEGIMVGYRGYEIENRKPRYPFGFGLSYTSFAYSNIRIETASQDGTLFTVSADVSNRGNISGDEIAQMYIGDLVSSVIRPIKELKGFERIHLEPGETKTVSFAIAERDLSFFDVSSNSWKAEKGEFDAYIGGCSDNCLSVRFRL